MTHDSHTRWNCPHCHRPGIDSWHKAYYDGSGLSETEVLSHFCQFCSAFLVVSYRGPAGVPHVIVPWIGTKCPASEMISLEDAAFAEFLKDPCAGAPLTPATMRDGDWSRGCLFVLPVAPECWP